MASIQGIESTYLRYVDPIDNSVEGAGEEGITKAAKAPTPAVETARKPVASKKPASKPRPRAITQQDARASAVFNAMER